MVAIESVKELAELARHLYYEGSSSSSSILNLEEEKFDFSLRVPVQRNPAPEVKFTLQEALESDSPYSHPIPKRVAKEKLKHKV